MNRCPYCTKSVRLENLVRHLNKFHVGAIRREDIGLFGLELHDVCGRVCTRQGMTRHINGCHPAVPEPVLNETPDSDSDPDHDPDSDSDSQPEPEPEPLHPPDPVPPPAPVDRPTDRALRAAARALRANVANPPPIQQPVQLEQPAVRNPRADAYLGWGERVVERREGAPIAYLNLAKYTARPFELISKSNRSVFAQEIQRLSAFYLNHPTEANMLRILSMPIAGLCAKVSDTRRALVSLRGKEADCLLDDVVARPHATAADPTPSDQPLSMRERAIISKHIRAGYLRKAAGIVRGQSGVAPPTPEVMEQMRNKHPVGVLNPFGDGHGPEPLVMNNESIATLDMFIKKLDMQSSPGISGWSPQLIQLCYGTPTEEKPFRSFLFMLARQINAGTAPGKAMLCASRLTPLQQEPAPKCRPIACGELFYRLSMRFLMKMLGIENMLLPSQLGVGSPCGVEPIAEMVNLEMKGLENLEDRYAYVLDFKNAFNAVKRSSLAVALRAHAPQYYRLAAWAYNDRSPLVMRYGDDLEIIPSAEGVRQGDPLGPLLFSLCLRSKLASLQNTVAGTPRDTVCAYLDDVYVFSDSAEKRDAILETFSRPDLDGLILNANKTKRISLVDVSDGDEDFPILGSMVGTVEARRAFLRSKIDDLRPVLTRLRGLPHQEALLLLRLCFAPQLMHLLRTMDLSDLEEELEELDMLFRDQLDFLRFAAPTHPADEKVKRVYSLPLSVGGCGVLNYCEIRPYARRASQRASRLVLRNMGVYHLLADDENAAVEPISQALLVKKHFMDRAIPAFLQTLSEDERIAFLDNGSKCGTAWIHAQPWRSGYHFLTDNQVATALNIRCLQSDVLRREVCPHCMNANSVLHFESCIHRRNPDTRQHRHDCVRDVLIQAIRSQGRVVQCEPPINNNNNNNNNNHQRADISVSAAAGVHGLDARYGLMDLTIKIPLAVDAARVRARALAPPLPPAAAPAAAPAPAPALALAHPPPPPDRDIPDRDEEDDQPDPDPRRPGWAQIEATLEFTAREKHNHYAHLVTHQPVLPIVMTSGGTLHKDAHKLLKDMFPSSDVRSRVRIDISLALVRGRAKAYSLQ